MTNRMLEFSAAFALLAVAPIAGIAALAAQEPARLAFGYQCDNKFALKNEGAGPVEVEYRVVGASETGRVRLDPNQGVSLEPRSAGDLEIRVDGKVVATARNAHSACQSGTVIVRPLYGPEYVTVVAPYYERYPYYGAYPVYVGPHVAVVTPRVGIVVPFGRSWYGNGGYGWHRHRHGH